MSEIREDEEEEVVQIKIGADVLEGLMMIPNNAEALVLLAHGKGNGRLSPPLQTVADAFNRAGLATLLVNLLTGREEEEDQETGFYRYDIARLKRRLAAVTEWVVKNPETRRLQTGCFATATAAAAALAAAAERPDSLKALVLGDGRPDLVLPELSRVTAPVLFVVGSDSPVLELNREAYGLVNAEKDLQVVPGSADPDAPEELETLIGLSILWFRQNLGTKPPALR